MSTASRPTAPLPQAASVAIGRLGVRLALPGPVADAVLSYRSAAARAALLMDLAGAEYALSALDWDDLAHAEDLMAGAKATLAAAGMLHLVASGDDHAKANEPRLPQRPRGPHPQTAGA